MKKWFEKWQAEKAKRKEKKLPAIVDYRDITYVSRTELTSGVRRLGGDADIAVVNAQAACKLATRIREHQQHCRQRLFTWSIGVAPGRLALTPQSPRAK
jgi:hypothetical protein